MNDRRDSDRLIIEVLGEVKQVAGKASGLTDRVQNNENALREHESQLGNLTGKVESASNQRASIFESVKDLNDRVARIEERPPPAAGKSNNLVGWWDDRTFAIKVALGVLALLVLDGAGLIIWDHALEVIQLVVPTVADAE